MKDFSVLEPAIDPNNRITFLLDWEITKKCNLDCSYCSIGINGGHDNSYPHPDKDECIKVIDNMYEYVDLYMSTKPPGIKYVILNVYGGEAMHHPDIIEILTEVRNKYKKYQDKWHLTITTTTNGIIKKEKLEKIIPLIDEFTFSFHAENTKIQKDWFISNAKIVKDNNKQIKCIVLMHPKHFDECVAVANTLKELDINHLPRQLDHSGRTHYTYTKAQMDYFEEMYNIKSFNDPFEFNINVKDDNIDLAKDAGRACCGGRQLCTDQNYKLRTFYVKNRFKDWYCSVNHFFVFIRQADGAIFVNKDCKVSFNGDFLPIGNINKFQELIDFTKDRITNNTLPVIKCIKDICQCGLCAPKAKDINDYNKIIRKYYK